MMMTFEEAVKAMDNGSFVRRAGWSKNIKLYAAYPADEQDKRESNNKRHIFAQIDSYEPEYAIFRISDIYGDDWYAINEDNITDNDL
jgi:hypothetical protein